MRILFLILLILCAPSFALDLKQSTAVTVEVGPFLDATDGVTPETGLGLADDIEISKAGAPFATVSSASLTSDSEGFYRFDMGTGETDTLGILIIKSVSSTVHVPVWHEFMVMPSNVWDSLYSTDKLQVHAAEISNDLITASAIATDAIGASEISASAIGASELAADSIGASELAANAIGSSEIAANALTAAKFATDSITSDEISSSAVTELQSGLATSSALTTVDTVVDGIQTDLDNGTDGLGALKALIDTVNTDLSNGTDGLGALKTLIDGLNDLSTSDIAGELATYDSPTKAELDTAIATLYTAANGAIADASVNGLETNVAKLLSTSAEIELDGSVYRLTTNALEQAPSGSGASAASIADAVWDEATSGHVASGSFGDLVDWLRDVAEADIVMGTTTTPWERILYIKDTSTELIKKKLYTDTSTAIGDKNTAVMKELESAP